MIIFIGLTGAGKSVQAKLLADKLKYPLLSTGEYLRDNPNQEFKHAMMLGNLVSDETMVGVVNEMLKKLGPKPEVILDGFPRTINQAKWLVDQNHKNNIAIHFVIHLVISQQVAKNRLLLRARPDDHEEAISKRFQEYDKSIGNIIKVLKDGSLKIVNINAENSVYSIHKDILKVIKKLNDTTKPSDKN